MKSHPILFSAPMVRALLDGSKTQTRRVVKHAPTPWNPAHTAWDMTQCQYGKVGDQLWVKESWKIANWNDDGDIDVFYPAQPSEFQHWVEIGILEDAKGNSVFERLWQQSTDDCLKAGLKTMEDGNFNFEGKPAPTRNRPSIFMPRAASRITLEITGVRVERLQDISEEDAKAEGTTEFIRDGFVKATKGKVWSEAVRLDPAAGPFKGAYACLWESINGAGTWALNQWVWVLEFKEAPPQQAAWPKPY